MSIEAMEEFDSHAKVRNQIRTLALMVGEWAGIPLPLEGQPLVMEPSYPAAEAIEKMGREKSGSVSVPDQDEWAGIERRGTFWSTSKRGTILIWRMKNEPRIQWGFAPGIHHLDHDLQTIGASFAWGIAQEARAQQLLASLLRHHQFKQYLLTGMFLESSRRSGVMYLFRRLRPTVAIRSCGDRLRILCTLCCHPIGYYSGSFAGAMCPTDDVIAHLMLMRCDERLFWSRSNQHAAYRPEAAL